MYAQCIFHITTFSPGLGILSLAGAYLDCLLVPFGCRTDSLNCVLQYSAYINPMLPVCLHMSMHRLTQLFWPEKVDAVLQSIDYKSQIIPVYSADYT